MRKESQLSLPTGRLEILGDTSALVYSNGLVFEDERMYDDLKYKLTTADGVEIYLTSKS